MTGIPCANFERLRQYAAAFVGLIWWSLASAADASDLNQVLAALRSELHDARVPGASIVIIENNQIAAQEDFGYADIAARIPVTADTLFRAGSIGKSFVGIAVMMLVERQKLSLDEKLSDLAPEIRYRNPWELTHPILLENLLEHTTGWQDMSPREFAADARGWTLRRAIDFGGTRVSRWPPGTYLSYSNVGPSVAAYIVEKAVGQTFDDYAKQTMFAPLEMPNTSFALTPPKGLTLSKSYQPDGQTPASYELSGLRPSGDLMTSARELANLPLVMLGRGRFKGRQLLTERSVVRIETSKTTLSARLGLSDNYGLGNDALVGHKAVFRGHGGAIDGFDSLYAYWPGHGAGYVVLVNGGEGVTGPMRDTLETYLVRREPAGSSNKFERPVADLAALAGIYQPLTQRSDFSRMIDDLTNFVGVFVTGGRLFVSGIERVPVGRYAIRRPDLAAPTYALAATQSRDELLSVYDAYRRVEPWALAAKALYGLLFVLISFLSLVYAPIWIVKAVRERWQFRRIVVRLMPLISVSSIVALGALFLIAISVPNSEQPRLFGAPSAVSVSLYAITFAIPSFSSAGLLACLVLRDGKIPRALGLAACTLGMIASVYLADFGWLGMRTWSL